MAAWKKHGRLERHHDRLISGFAARGISVEFGEQLYKQIHGFGEYGFPESHAASFALLVYASSWLKVHHPAAFACALLNSQPMGFYSPSSIVRDAQAHGVSVLPVSVVRSTWDNTLEGGALRLGLRQVKGVGEAVANAIVAVRSERPFSSQSDLIHRARVKKNEIEALAEAGALFELVPERRDALWQARAPREGGLFDGVLIEAEDPVGLPPMRRVEQLVFDYARLGLSIGDHPMCHLRGRMAKLGVKRASDLRALRDGAAVRVAGLVIGRQRPATASGVTFVTLEDETGMVNLVVTKKVWADDFAVARHAKLMVVRGRLEKEGEVIHVLAKKLERVELAGAHIDARSRDFH
jgi:error-prone DNA polymerase